MKVTIEAGSKKQIGRFPNKSALLSLSTRGGSIGVFSDDPVQTNTHLLSIEDGDAGVVAAQNVWLQNQGQTNVVVDFEAIALVKE